MKRKILLGILIVVALLILFFLIGLWQERRAVQPSYRRGGSFADTTYSTSAGLGARSPSFGAPSFFNKSVSSETPIPSSPKGSGESAASDRLIIKTGRLSMIVSDMADAVRTARSTVLEKGGYVVSSNLEMIENRPLATMTFRVPAKLFDESLTAFRGFAKKVTSEYVTGEDVTEEYTDFGAQLKNLEATEAQFLKILEKAEQIQDILAVQSQLSQVRGNIERLKGRIQYLERSAAMATLTVHLALDEAALPVIEEQQWRPWVQVKNAVRSLLISLKALVTLIIWLVIYAVIWVPLFFLVRFLYHWWKRKKGAVV